jgi:D-ribose pyranase
VFRAVRANFEIGKIVMAEEFRQVNDLDTVRSFEQRCGDIPVIFEPHQQLKPRVPLAMGLIRTGKTVRYVNIIWSLHSSGFGDA